MTISIMTIGQAEHQDGNRHREQRDDPKLLPGKTRIDVSDVTQHGRDDDRGEQRSKDALELSVESFFHLQATRPCP